MNKNQFLKSILSILFDSLGLKKYDVFDEMFHLFISESFNEMYEINKTSQRTNL